MNKKIIILFFLIILAILVLYPVYFALISSLKSIDIYNISKLDLPKSFYLENYFRIFSKYNFHIYVINSVITVGISMVLYIFICAAAGLAFGKFNFKGKLIIFILILLFQVFPQMVIAGELYQLLSRIRLINTKAGLILAWLAYFCPFGTYIMTTYFSTVPKDIMESARIDGTNVFQLLVRIMMPIAKPMLGTIGIIGSLSMWNELPFAMMILQQNNLRTVPVGIAMMQGEFGLPVPVLASAVIISAIIPTIFYMFFQKYIAMDVTAGAIKG